MKHAAHRTGLTPSWVMLSLHCPKAFLNPSTLRGASRSGRRVCLKTPGKRNETFPRVQDFLLPLASFCLDFARLVRFSFRCFQGCFLVSLKLKTITSTTNHSCSHCYYLFIQIKLNVWKKKS